MFNSASVIQRYVKLSRHYTVLSNTNKYTYMLDTRNRFFSSTINKNENLTFTNLHCVLFEPEIPNNAGAIGRTCIAFGATLHLIEPLGFEISDKRVKRAGLDYWAHVKLFTYKNWDDFECRGPKGTRFFFSKGGEEPLESIDFSAIDIDIPIVFVFGSETIGIDKLRRRLNFDRIVAIPMLNTQIIRSLNLANCASLVLWEAFKSRRRLVR